MFLHVAGRAGFERKGLLLPHNCTRSSAPYSCVQQATKCFALLQLLPKQWGLLIASGS